MVRVYEDDVLDSLLKYTGEGSTAVGDAEVTVELEVDDIHRFDSPDFILWMTVEIDLEAKTLKSEVPLPVEAESSGLGDAGEDLEKLVNRENYLPSLPMLVVAASGWGTEEEMVQQSVNYVKSQIPERAIDD